MKGALLVGGTVAAGYVLAAAVLEDESVGTVRVVAVPVEVAVEAAEAVDVLVVLAVDSDVDEAEVAVLVAVALVTVADVFVEVAPEALVPVALAVVASADVAASFTVLVESSVESAVDWASATVANRASVVRSSRRFVERERRAMVNERGTWAAAECEPATAGCYV